MNIIILFLQASFEFVTLLSSEPCIVVFASFIMNVWTMKLSIMTRSREPWGSGSLIVLLMEYILAQHDKHINMCQPNYPELI